MEKTKYLTLMILVAACVSCSHQNTVRKLASEGTETGNPIIGSRDLLRLKSSTYEIDQNCQEKFKKEDWQKRDNNPFIVKIETAEEQKERLDYRPADDTEEFGPTRNQMIHFVSDSGWAYPVEITPNKLYLCADNDKSCYSQEKTEFSSREVKNYTIYKTNLKKEHARNLVFVIDNITQKIVYVRVTSEQHSFPFGPFVLPRLNPIYHTVYCHNNDFDKKLIDSSENL